MKSTRLASYCVLAIAPLFALLAGADKPYCITYYGTSAVKSVRSYTRSATETFTPIYQSVTHITLGTSTEISKLSTILKTTTVSMTYTTTVASTTITVPTHAGFVPIISGATVTNPNPTSTAKPTSEHKRALRRPHRSRRVQQAQRFRRSRRAVSTKLSSSTGTLKSQLTYHPTLVHCVQSFSTYAPTSTRYETITDYSTTDTTGTTTVISTISILRATATTTTVHANQVTAYQGCEMPENRLDSFHGNPMYGFDYRTYDTYTFGYIQEDYNTYNVHRGGNQETLQGPRSCCHAAFAKNCLGWAFSAVDDDITRSCKCILPVPKGAYSWSFLAESGETLPKHVYAGNGPLGVPLYGGDYYLMG